ncbi:hypothetical protein, partial [Pseudomonas sp. MPBD4-3]|uniref:hypothetical protein n=1 Tax=Pseudomonas sp. MPBD4-3 TaxID=2070575 RepID=UPI000CC4627C
IGGKPPPTFLTRFGFQDQVGYKAASLWLLILGEAPSGFTGRLRSRSKAEQKQSKVYLIYGDSNVGGGLPPIAVDQSCM